MLSKCAAARANASLRRARKASTPSAASSNTVTIAKAMINGPALPLTSAADFPFFPLVVCRSVRHPCLAEFQTARSRRYSADHTVFRPQDLICRVTAYRSAGNLLHGLTIMVGDDASIHGLKASSGQLLYAGFSYAMRRYRGLADAASPNCIACLSNVFKVRTLCGFRGRQSVNHSDVLASTAIFPSRKSI